MRDVVALAQARSRLTGALSSLGAARVPGTERVPLGAALGRVLADAAVAPWDLPPFDRSLVDGWAVRGVGVGPLPVAGEVRMGAAAPPLPPGTVFAIPTGGMLPAGADAVVMKEHARAEAGGVGWLRPAEPGANIIRRGDDARRGDVLVPPGRRLRPMEVALLAAAGVAEVCVHRRPRIAVLSTGDELDPPGPAPAAGRVPDANGPALAAALARDGCEPVVLPAAPDDREAIHRAVVEGLGHGTLICTGGSSVGERDFVQAALREAMGAAPLFEGIAMRPGRPTAAFAAPGRWAVALPGHTVSALVVYELLLRAPLLRQGGETQPLPRGAVEALLSEAVRAPADRDLFVRVRLEPDGAGWAAVPLAGSSAAVGSLARADGLVPCPAGASLTPRSLVSVLLLD